MFKSFVSDISINEYINFFQKESRTSKIVDRSKYFVANVLTKDGIAET